MQPSYIPISQVFSQDQRFTVPLFQRPYVWNREEQWEPLWDDVIGVLDRLKAREGDAVVASHFLGTIVLEQKPTATGSLPRREVIDGQQRLATLKDLVGACFSDTAMNKMKQALVLAEGIDIKRSGRPIRRGSDGKVCYAKTAYKRTMCDEKVGLRRFSNAKSGKVHCFIPRSAPEQRLYDRVGLILIWLIEAKCAQFSIFSSADPQQHELRSVLT